jgi:hypothetical protein
MDIPAHRQSPFQVVVGLVRPRQQQLVCPKASMGRTSGVSVPHVRIMESAMNTSVGGNVIAERYSINAPASAKPTMASSVSVRLTSAAETRMTVILCTQHVIIWVRVATTAPAILAGPVTVTPAVTLTSARAARARTVPPAPSHRVNPANSRTERCVPHSCGVCLQRIRTVVHALQVSPMACASEDGTARVQRIQGSTKQHAQ